MTEANITQSQPVISVAPSAAVTFQLPITEPVLLKVVEIGGSPAVLLGVCFAGSVALLRTVLKGKR